MSDHTKKPDAWGTKIKPIERKFQVCPRLINHINNIFLLISLHKSLVSDPDLKLDNADK